MTGSRLTSGFTLIELSIVLVIIGLIVGGVLVGRDLITASQVRAQVSQIEKFNIAANTFKEKYGYLPGDIPNPEAPRFGFLSRGLYAGEGDGNGLLEGVYADLAGVNWSAYQSAGETSMFWADLSTARLIDGSFTMATPTTIPATPTVNGLFPQAKIGNNNSIIAYGISPTGFAWFCLDIVNWCWKVPNAFGLVSITGFGGGGRVNTTVGLTVAQAYAIDKKTDDGLPFAGRIEVLYPNGGLMQYPKGNGGTGANPYAAESPSSTTCYDNNNVNGIIDQYSTTQGGANVNCALSFLMQ